VGDAPTTRPSISSFDFFTESPNTFPQLHYRRLRSRRSGFYGSQLSVDGCLFGQTASLVVATASERILCFLQFGLSSTVFECSVLHRAGIFSRTHG
jgi:hypothetical protein